MEAVSDGYLPSREARLWFFSEFRRTSMSSVKSGTVVKDLWNWSLLLNLFAISIKRLSYSDMCFAHDLSARKTIGGLSEFRWDMHRSKAKCRRSYLYLLRKIFRRASFYSCTAPYPRASRFNKTIRNHRMCNLNLTKRTWSNELQVSAIGNTKCRRRSMTVSTVLRKLVRFFRMSQEPREWTLRVQNIIWWNMPGPL